MSLSKGDKTRLRIISAATELIYKNGLNNVTFAQIARRSGISQPAIYNHFKNMDDIFIESALHWSGEAKDFIDGAVPALEPAETQLKSIVHSNLAYPHQNRERDSLFLGLYYFSISSKKALDAYREIRQSGISRFHMLVAQGNRERCWDVKKPREVAESIHSLLVGEVFKIIVDPNEEALKSREDRCWRGVLNMLNR